MKLSFPRVNEILKTLPISYYVKRKLDVELDENIEMSFCDIMNDKIRISFKQLQKTAEPLNPEDNNVENDIRCMLYHETSHAYLTPLTLTPNILNNIFEDERIESLLRHYYKDVNFREFIKRVNNFHNEPPKNPQDMFYQVVRYRIGPTMFVNRVDDIIKTYAYLTRNDAGDYRPYDYERAIRYLYEDIQSYFAASDIDKLKENLKDDYSKPTSKRKSSILTDDLSDISSFDKETLDKHINEFIQNECDDEALKDEELTDVEDVLTDIVDRYFSKEVFDDINSILMNVKNSTKNNSSAINAYSGVFNPRSVIRDDYKYFVQQNRIGHVKAFSKIHLNLFIDSSGSFRSNDDIVNRLLYALTKFEKANPNFSFDLISCGMRNVLRAKDDRIQDSCGGNALTVDIFDIVKQVLKPGSMNVNIVLFDGDAFTDLYEEEKRRNFRNFEAFNIPNTVVISDYANQFYIERYCKQTKNIFTTDYTTELYKNVLIALNRLCK